jgi:hypothetical protein
MVHTFDSDQGLHKPAWEFLQKSGAMDCYRSSFVNFEQLQRRGKTMEHFQLCIYWGM